MTRKHAAKAQDPTLVLRPLTPQLVDALGVVFRGNWGAGCWCMYPRLTAAQMRGLPGSGTATQRWREAMTELARRPIAPGLLAFEGEDAVGWIASCREASLRGWQHRARHLRSTTRRCG